VPFILIFKLEMKLIWALILAGVCGFMSYGLWVDSEKETKNETLVNHEFLNSFEDVISWQPAESAVNLNEIPNWQTLSKSTGSNELINNLIASFSEIGVSAELNLHVFLSDKGSMVRITSTSEEISALFGSIFSVAMHENNQLLSKGKLSGRRIEGMGFISSNSEFLEKTFQVVENQKPLDIPMGKLFWKTNSHANIWFERDEITVNGPAVIEFKKRNGFLYGYCFIQDSLINDENLGVTYSIWDFQLPGNPQSFTVEPFPVRDLDKTQVKEVEEICNCDVKTAWKSWNTHQVYLFNQDGLQFYGVQALEDLPATSGLYPFIADGAKMYKGYQIQELISGADVSGIYSDMFGREVSHFIDLEEQVFFFSALSEAKDFITLIQNKSFNYLVDSRLQELLLLSPDFTEYNGISSTGEPVVYQFEQKDNGGYYHALWKSEGTSAFITSNASSSKADSPSQEPNKNTGVSTELWEKQIEGKLVKSPFLFTNHYTKAKELALVTDKNELVLMSAEGEILWSRKLEEEILGEIHQVDLFRNNKFQMVFSTRKRNAG